MSPRSLTILLCVCAIGSADAGCAKKRAVVTPLPPVTVAKSYPGKAALQAMREAIGKLRGNPPRAGTGSPARRVSREQPVGTRGTDGTPQPPRPASSIGRDTAPAAMESSDALTAHAAPASGSEGVDPLVALIVGGWVALLVLLPLAVRYGWRG